MKCKYCGAEIKEGSNICEYCGSQAEREAPQPQTIIIERKSSAKYIIKTIGIVIVVLAIVWAVAMIIFSVIVFNSDAFKNINQYSSYGDASYRLPADEAGMIAQIINCDQNGTATIDYRYHTYENVQIIDKALIEWLNETGRTINGIEICFATDGDGNIRELGLLSADFFVTAKEGTRYTAIREGKVIAFSAEAPLETDRCYSGYFSYPEMRLYYGEERNLFYLDYMELRCTDKEETVQQDSYTSEDITVYRLFIGEKWYYCSRETYDAVLVNDLLDDYELYEEDGLAFVVPNRSNEY